MRQTNLQLQTVRGKQYCLKQYNPLDSRRSQGLLVFVFDRISVFFLLELIAELWKIPQKPMYTEAEILFSNLPKYLKGNFHLAKQL